MSYTIASLTDIQGVLVVDFGKNGNMNEVSLYNIETKELSIKKFDKMEDAYIIFEKLSKAIIFGEYSEEVKRSWLK